MPITQSAIKAHRQSLRKNAQNTLTKAKMKSVVKEFNSYITTDLNKAKEIIPKVYKLIDKSTKRGVLTKNSAARKKSRLMSKFHKASAIE